MESANRNLRQRSGTLDDIPGLSDDTKRMHAILKRVESHEFNNSDIEDFDIEDILRLRIWVIWPNFFLSANVYTCARVNIGNFTELDLSSRLTGSDLNNGDAKYII